MDPRSIQTSTSFSSCRAFVGIVIVLLFLAPHFAFPQATGGSVQGRILDENGQPLPGASITATHKLTGGTRTVTSDNSGFYRISELKVGAYEFTVTLSGFATQVRSGVNLLVGQQAQLDFTMKVASVEESIVVDADVPVFEPTKTSIGATITKQQIDDLPLQNRDFVNLAFLAPGITFARTEATDISGSGSTGSSNTFLIDGLSNDQDAIGDSRGDFSPDAISEFQVMSSSYNAEYGQATGAVINVISRTGTNDYHGRVSTFYRADGLSASNPFAVNTPFDETIVGGTFGGPIVKNKTFFFGSYEHTFLNDTAVVAVDPQLLASLGLSTQTTVDQPFREPRLLLKLDQHFSENNSLTARYRLDNRKRENDSVGDLVSGTAVLTEEGGFTFKTKDQDFAVSDNWILSDTMLNEARFQFAREDNDLSEPNCPGCPFILRPTVGSGKLPNQPQTVSEDRYEFLDALSFNMPGKAGDHYFKAGFDFSHIALSAFLPQNFDGVFIFNTDQPFNPADQNTYPFIYQVGSGNPNIDINNNVVALYFQDQWNVTPNLTFNLGIRWDYEDHIMIKGDHNNIGPRLHFAWDPFKKGTTAIRGGYGRYYDQIFLNAPLISSIFEPGRFNSQTILFPGYPDPYVGGAQIPFPLPPSESVLDPNAQTPSKDVATAGFQHAITHDMAITADYVYAKSHNLLVLINSNQPINGVLPDPDVGIIYEITTAGRATYNALQVGLQKRFGSRYSLNLAYTLASNKTNAHGSQSFASNAYDIEADFGPSDDDIRNTLTVAGLYDGPWGLKIGASTSYLSSPPFNVVTGGDENGDGQLNDRPAGVPYNSMRGDPLWTVNARLAKVFNISQTRLEVLIEAFNLFNRENAGNFNGNILSPDFAMPTGLVDNFPPRQVQLGVRFDF